MEENRIKHGWKQYPHEIARIWDDYVSWEKRRRGEGNFFSNILKEHQVRTVLDISCGTGYDSIKLIKEGFKVKSCDGSKEMIKIALKNAKKEKVEMNVVQCDWRNLIEKFGNERFDAIICLGNSFTHLFLDKDRQSVVNQIYFLLNGGGILIIDQRNYDYILSKGYKSKHKYYYCGKKFKVSFIEKRNDYVKAIYSIKEDGEFILEYYPIKFNEMKNLIKNSGFESIKTYGDFSKDFDNNNTDFFQHIAVK